MPRRQLSANDWNLVVRTLADAQHLFCAMNGATFVEQGTAIEDATPQTSFVVDTTQDIRAIETALRALGYDFRAEDPPPPLNHQLSKLLGRLSAKG